MPVPAYCACEPVASCDRSGCSLHFASSSFSTATVVAGPAMPTVGLLLSRCCCCSCSGCPMGMSRFWVVSTALGLDSQSCIGVMSCVVDWDSCMTHVKSCDGSQLKLRMYSCQTSESCSPISVAAEHPKLTVVVRKCCCYCGKGMSEFLVRANASA